MPDHYLGIDVGTTAVKALVVNEDGAVVGEAESPLEVSVPSPGWSEQHPLDWWKGTVEAVRASMETAGARDVRAIGLSGQMHSSVLLDEDDRVVRPAILWNDVRTTAQCRFITERVGKAGLRRLVGNPALEGFTAPKLLWVREHEPELFGRTRHAPAAQGLCPVLDDRGSGYRAIRRRRNTSVRREAGALVRGDDHGHAVGPWDAATSVRFVRNRGNIDRGRRRRIGPTARHAGRGRRRRQRRGGCWVGCRHAQVPGGSTQTSIGTSGAVVAPIERPRVDPGMRIHSFNHAVDATWYLMGVTLSAGAALGWYRQTLAGPGGSLPEYEELIAEAAATDPGANGLTFLPYLTGERTPHADSNARGAFSGTERRPQARPSHASHHGRRHLCAARLSRTNAEVGSGRH